MEAAELWDGDNLSHRYLPLEETDIACPGSGRSRFMVVAEIGRQRSLEMAGVWVM
jgi:hypothetical protein